MVNIYRALLKLLVCFNGCCSFIHDHEPTEITSSDRMKLEAVKSVAASFAPTHPPTHPPTNLGDVGGHRAAGRRAGLDRRALLAVEFPPVTISNSVRGWRAAKVCLDAEQ